MVKKEDLPRTYRDLLDPKWKGKLGIEARVPEWYATVAMDMGEEKGIRFFRELVAKNGITVRGGHTLLNNLVVAGDVPLALTMYQYAALLFYEFMLSTEAQQLLLEMDYVPTLSKLPSPLANRRFKLVDPAIALDHREKWDKSFEEVIIKRSGQ